jgi:hypothetical protein
MRTRRKDGGAEQAAMTGFAVGSPALMAACRIPCQQDPDYRAAHLSSLVPMNSKLISAQIQIMAAQAAIFSKETNSDWHTSIYFKGKTAGFEMFLDAEIEVVRRGRDHAQAEALRERAKNDLNKYQYFEGIAAAAAEVLGLHLISEESL